MDWMLYGKTFLVGGLLCALGQLGLSLTRLTTARILVVYVTAGVVLGGLGLYGPLVDWAGAGATVPLTGFGYALSQGAKKAVAEQGLLGAFTGGITHRRRHRRGHLVWISVRFAGKAPNEDMIRPDGNTPPASCP